MLLSCTERQGLIMIFYFASATYQQVISSAIRETDQILDGQECGNDIYFLKYVKGNYTKFSSLETLIVDLNAIADTDEEIVEALDALKILNYDMRIIVLAANRYVGDPLLTKCFQMGIYDLIVSDDFLEISLELKESIRVGKKYADSLRFRDSNSEKVIVKEEIKQTVNKIMIGIAGTDRRIGVTHHSIVLANFLRKKGYMVAIVEAHMATDFMEIKEFYEEKIFEDSYFSMNEIDYYPYKEGGNTLANALGKSYNFILADFGIYKDSDLVLFNKSDVRIILTGSKAWELEETQEIFSTATEETLKGYNFYFNFTAHELEADLKEGMGSLNSIYFLGYTENPFKTYEFPGANEILKDYMPLKIAQEKKGVLGRRKNEKEKK